MSGLTPPVIPDPPQAVLFDLDGTLVDSERDVAAALDVVLRRTGRPLSDEEKAFVIGHGWADIHDHLSRHGGLSLSLPALEDAVFAVRVARPGSSVTILPGATALVRRAASQVPCALVTGSSRQEAELMLAVLGVRDCFRALSCAGEYPRGKPAPDPYLHGAAALGVDPAGCLVLEDSRAGIASARAAGMFCIAVRAGNFAGQDQSGAHLILDDLTQVDALLKWR